MAMGLALSPVITNFFMEGFEEVALNQAVHKPPCWIHYVDDTVIWPHGPNRLRDFLGMVLSEHNIKSVGLPLRKFSSFLLQVNNNLELKTPGVYHPVQKVSDLRPGKKSCVPGGAQFLIPFKVGPL
jgi:hypothetical protein